MRVLVADALETEGLKALEDLGVVLDVRPELTGDTLTEALRESAPQVLVVRSTKVTKPMTEPAGLGLVIRAGAGVNTIDVPACSARGIWVSNCPGRNAIAVAELTIGLILATDRHLTTAPAELRAGVFDKGKSSKAKGLFGLHLGLLGLGAIGTEVASRAQALGMRVKAWSPRLTEARAKALGIEHAGSPEAAVANADIVSMHLALTPETNGLVNEALLRHWKPDGWLINTARAEMVVEADLIAALNASPQRRVATDVFDGEPAQSKATVTSALLAHPQVVATPHIGASTAQAQISTALEVAHIVKAYMTTGKPLHAVNLAQSSPATHILVVRHFDRVGVLACVFSTLRELGINAQETENVVFQGAEAAIATIHIALGDLEPTALPQRIALSSPDILDVRVTEAPTRYARGS